MGKSIIISGTDFVENALNRVSMVTGTTILVLADENGNTSGSGTYQIGESVTIEAIPNNGYVFNMWSDGSVEQQRTIIVGSEPTTFIATFINGVEVVENISQFASVPVVTHSEGKVSLNFNQAISGSAIVKRSEFPIRIVKDVTRLKFIITARAVNNVVHCGFGTSISASYGDNSPYYKAIDISTTEQTYELEILAYKDYLDYGENEGIVWIGRHRNNCSTTGTIIITSLYIEIL